MLDSTVEEVSKRRLCIEDAGFTQLFEEDSCVWNHATDMLALLGHWQELRFVVGCHR